MLRKQIIQSREAPQVLNKFKVIWENKGVFYTWNGAKWVPLKDSEGPMTDEDKEKLDNYPTYEELKKMIGSGGSGECTDIEELTTAEIDSILAI